jgi:hypothetical protein
MIRRLNYCADSHPGSGKFPPDFSSDGEELSIGFGREFKRPVPFLARGGTHQEGRVLQADYSYTTR